MSSYKIILLASDLSEASMYVAKKANKIAKSNEAAIHIVHAMESFPTYSWGYAQLQKFEEAIETEAKSRLASVLKSLKVPAANGHLRNQISKVAIIELAKEIKADLIIVGSHTHHSILGTLGSTASSVVNNAECDVLVIRHLEDGSVKK